MATLAGTTLVWPGTILDNVWALNRPAYKELAFAGRPVGALFLLLGAALLSAAMGWFQRRRWGWRLTVAIICTQVAGDIFNFARGDHLRGGIGVAIAGALLFYLLRSNVRTAFHPTP